MNQTKPRKGYKFVKGLFGKYEEIPEEWEVTRHGYVCEFINGYAYSEKEFSDKGYQIIRIQNLTGGTNFVHSNIKLPEKQFVVDGDLLFAWSATFSPFIWHGKKSAFHYHQWKIIPNELSDKMFLFYHFKQKTPLIKNMGQSGLGMFHITKHAMEQFLFLKPPLSEQQKIASILSNVDTLIENTQKIIDTTIKLKKELMQKLLTTGIGHTKFKKVKSLFGKYKEIPEEWNSQQIINCCNILDSQRIPVNSEQRNQMLGNIPYYGANGIQGYVNDYIFDEDLILLAEDGGYFEDYKTRPISQYVVGPCWVNNHVHVLNSKNNYYLKYIYYSLVHKNITPFINGSTRTKLNQSDLKKITILIPPLSEQQKIASILSNVDSLIQLQKNNKDKLEHLKKSLMQKLLTGKVRVKI